MNYYSEKAKLQHVKEVGNAQTVQTLREIECARKAARQALQMLRQKEREIVQMAWAVSNLGIENAQQYLDMHTSGPRDTAAYNVISTIRNVCDVD